MSAEPEHVWLLQTLEEFGPLSVSDLLKIARKERGEAHAASSSPSPSPFKKQQIKALLKPEQLLMKAGWVQKLPDGRFALTEQGISVLDAQASMMRRESSGDEPNPRVSRLDLLRTGIREVQNSRYAKLEYWLSWIVIFLGLSTLVMIWELKTSRLSAKFFHIFAQRLTFELKDEEQVDAYHPAAGPYDQRLGYTRLPQLVGKLKKYNYEVTQQASLSPAHLGFVKSGFYPIYDEKTQAGLSIVDRAGRSIFDAKFPAQVYKNFDDIPEAVYKTLLFIEDQKLLDTSEPYRNPAVEWTRLTRAVIDKGSSLLLRDRGVPGGSTLATQIEKFKHSNEGITRTPHDKFAQMVTASVRAFQDGEVTIAVRQKLVVDYINSVPSGAIPIYGEVLGLGNGLKAWYGRDFDEVNRLLRNISVDEPDLLSAKAMAYKQVLSLFLAHRRPGLYLQRDPAALMALTDKYLNVLPKAGVISAAFAQAVRSVKIDLVKPVPQQKLEGHSFVERKGANAIRLQLLQQMGVKNLYELDHFDLKVTSSIDAVAQSEVTKILQEIRDPANANGFGLNEERLLQTGDPAQVHYSFVLMERLEKENVLRVQTDSLDGPFNLNESGKLELGSTAKLRVLINYLQIIERIFLGYAGQSDEALKLALQAKLDPLSRWVLQFMQAQPEGDLNAILEAALQHTYSASPYEQFFTGGGLHSFSNFQPEDNGKLPTVIHAFSKSMNLPFVRMMRDIVAFELHQIPEYPEVLELKDSPQREALLRQFADKESRTFLARYYRKFKSRTYEESLAILAKSLARTSRAFAVAMRTTDPDASLEQMIAFIESNLSKVSMKPEAYQKIYEEFAAENPQFSLHDRGYVARVHPLELWMIRYLRQHPKAGWTEVVKASYDDRISVYRWLLEAQNKAIQNSRIQVMLEEQAFQSISMSWRKLGFPFGSLIPTLASALGSSGDRPSALAELVGIIQSGGYRYETIRSPDIHFAKDTPYELRLLKKAREPEQVLSTEVAAAAKTALRSVVEEGTGRRVKEVLDVPGCGKIAFGGKTGTGDNRYKMVEAGRTGQESKVINRTATFVFSIGERYFGTITAYVPSDAASGYQFTSALPVQILKIIAPRILPSALGFPECQAEAAPPPSVP